MTPDILEAELAQLPDDLPHLAENFSAQLAGPAETAAARGVRDVTVVGSGDSLHAGLAAQLAFHSLGGVNARAMSVHEFPIYADEWLRPTMVGRRLVVVVSASGATQGALATADEARSRGLTVLSVVGEATAPLASLSDVALAYHLPDRVRSPGVRTYQASLVGLLLLATRLGVLGGLASPAEADAVRRGLGAVAEGLRRTDPLQRTALAEAGDLAGGPIIFLGTGPHRGTAKHAAAKVVEASGVLAIGQELEEWWHVERMADPADMTTFVIATARSAARAGQIAAAAAARGRRVVLVAPRGDAPAAPAGTLTLPVAEGIREELSPLAYQGFGVQVAASLARCLGRRAFEGGDVGALTTVGISGTVARKRRPRR